MCATKMLKRLVPRLGLGTHTFRALPGNGVYFSMAVEAEPPCGAFPGGAWEREILNIVAQLTADTEL